ncbi:MAG TPA: DegT/DnrJ/EryC1/StrS family aminotransferase [Candidatus Eisenbacteria bacterium]|nr:DegT/DnrJ/EryC1/StrS family aminotransferase [Candidatus Eisenbacteria bacterium]
MKTVPTGTASTATPVPLLDLGLAHRAIAEELKRDFERVLTSGQFILGAEHDAFERELAQAAGLTHAIGLSSGTSAITLALQALGVGPGDEVILPAFTYFATASAVAHAGATPVFADVEPHRFGLDWASVESRLGPRTKAILAVHLYGLACDLAPLTRLAQTRAIPLLEDAAQAIGATDQGVPVGKADAGATLSFFPTKNLGALGDAGAFVTDRDDVAWRVRLLSRQGDAGDYRHTVVGTNARLDALQAAFLRTKLRHLEAWVTARRDAAQAYREALAGVPVTLPEEPAGAKHTYHQFTIRAPRRDALQSYLREQGVATRIYYPIPLHIQPAFAHLGLGPGTFPVSEQLAGEVISLPLFPGITREQIERVASCVRAFYTERPSRG